MRSYIVKKGVLLELEEDEIESILADWSSGCNSDYTTGKGYRWIQELQNKGPVNSFEYIWKKFVPPKAQIFAWFAVQNAIPTIDKRL